MLSLLFFLLLLPFAASNLTKSTPNLTKSTPNPLVNLCAQKDWHGALDRARQPSLSASELFQQDEAHGNTALHYAALYGSPSELVKLLLSVIPAEGGFSKTLASVACNKGFLPLHHVS